MYEAIKTVNEESDDFILYRTTDEYSILHT